MFSHDADFWHEKKLLVYWVVTLITCNQGLCFACNVLLVKNVSENVGVFVKCYF